jgi:hypothetical protein
MIWNFNAITPGRGTAMTSHCMRIEHYAFKWAKDFARERHAPPTKVIRELLQQAVAHWRKEDHTLGFPWGPESKVGASGDIAAVMLDADTLMGLREIMDVSGKTLSRATSEILLDAMKAETASMEAGLMKRAERRGDTTKAA